MGESSCATGCVRSGGRLSSWLRGDGSEPLGEVVGDLAARCVGVAAEFDGVGDEYAPCPLWLKEETDGSAAKFLADEE
jgi:hypothetical protein